MNELETYIIGEIGQNHNGSVDIAKLIIDLIARPVEEETFGIKVRGMDAVKLTKRDLSQELSASQMNAPYNSPHSFGKTYGEHRAFLELNDEQHFEIYKHAKSHDLEFVETLCAPGCLSILRYFSPDYLKVASRDLTNIPLLEALAEVKIPMIISTGMAGNEELDQALNTITRFHNKISILHCVSQYPTRPHNVNLNTITYLKKNYPAYRIGYSDHTIGIATPVAAVAMGAKVIEKHITVDRRLKGTDQAGSLGPEGVYRMVRDIRIMDMQMGKEEMFICDETMASRVKLERSIALNRDLKAGDTISREDLHMLSPGDGFKWNEIDSVVGKKMAVDLGRNEIVYQRFLK